MYAEKKTLVQLKTLGKKYEKSAFLNALDQKCVYRNQAFTEIKEVILQWKVCHLYLKIPQNWRKKNQ